MGSVDTADPVGRVEAASPSLAADLSPSADLRPLHISMHGNAMIAILHARQA